MKRIIIGMFVALTVAGAIAGETNVPPRKHVKLLAIGNSFSGNATQYLPQIVKAAGDKLTLRSIAIGGCPLEKHWRNADLFQQKQVGTNKEVRAWSLLTTDKWDYITIQQNSINSFKLETYRPYAGKLHAYLKQQCPESEVLIHETWAYRSDDPLFKDGFTQQDMYWKLRRAYETIAGEVGSRILPVGDAFENARRDSEWGGVFPDPNFDPKTAVAPALPDQKHSLNVGYTWKKNKLSYDGHHANVAGQYLGAAVWYEFLFGRSVVGNKFVPPGMTAADVAILQRIAHQTVSEGLKPKP